MKLAPINITSLQIAKSIENENRTQNILKESRMSLPIESTCVGRCSSLYPTLSFSFDNQIKKESFILDDSLNITL